MKNTPHVRFKFPNEYVQDTYERAKGRVFQFQQKENGDRRFVDASGYTVDLNHMLWLIDHGFVEKTLNYGPFVFEYRVKEA